MVTTPTALYTLSLHDALPILLRAVDVLQQIDASLRQGEGPTEGRPQHEVLVGRLQKDHAENFVLRRSEEHTSELQSPDHLVCRLLLEKQNERPCFALPHLAAT